MVTGESKRLNLTAGRRNDLCQTGVWAAEPGVVVSTAFQEEQEADALYIWRFDVAMHEIATDKIVFDLIWERTSRATPNESLRRTQRVTLREDESRAIDIVHGTSGDCLSVAVDVIAYVQDDASPQGKTLEWDLWFSGPQPAPVHRALTTLHGQSGAFEFEPRATAMTQAAGTVVTTTVHVYGQLRGRLRADGNIDVALTAHRIVNSAQSHVADSLKAAVNAKFLRPPSSGQKNFIMTPAEAVKIVLPPLNLPPPVQFRTDPVTGERTVSVIPQTARPSVGAASEMSITVQARVR